MVMVATHGVRGVWSGVLPRDQLPLPVRAVGGAGNLPPLVWVLVGVAVLCPWLCPWLCPVAVPVAVPMAVLGSSHCTHRFSAGDVVMIQPQNCPEDVQQFCQLLRLEPHRRFVLEPTEPGRSCLLLLPFPAETGHPLSSGPAWSSALPLLQTWLAVLDGHRTPACLAVQRLSFPPVLCVWILCRASGTGRHPAVPGCTWALCLGSPSTEWGGSCSLLSPRPKLGILCFLAWVLHSVCAPGTS